MKIKIMMEDGNENRMITKDYGEAWDFDVYAACDLFRDAFQVFGFTYIENVTASSEDHEWSCRF